MPKEIFTVDDLLGMLPGLGERALKEELRKHGCASVVRGKLYVTHVQFDRFMRMNQCHSRSSGGKASPISTELLPVNAYDAALELATRSSPSKSASRQKHRRGREPGSRASRPRQQAHRRAARQERRRLRLLPHRRARARVAPARAAARELRAGGLRVCSVGLVFRAPGWRGTQRARAPALPTCRRMRQAVTVSEPRPSCARASTWSPPPSWDAGATLPFC